MQSIELDGWNEFDAALAKVIGNAPIDMRELHEKIADALTEEIGLNISSSGLNDSGGRIKSWQVKHVGSGGGYAAIRPIKGATGNNSPGAITNYLENGHKIRSPGTLSKRYRPRIKKVYVNGYHFYHTTKTTIQRKVIDIAEKQVEKIKKELEGG